jgi:hypothetical protein
VSYGRRARARAEGNDRRALNARRGHAGLRATTGGHVVLWATLRRNDVMLVTKKGSQQAAGYNTQAGTPPRCTVVK